MFFQLLRKHHTNVIKVFMTRKDLTCVHEPFGDAFYFGPERMSSRFEEDVETRESSGFSASTYKTIFDRLEREGEEVWPLPKNQHLAWRWSGVSLSTHI
jgi:hypothetical protein